MRRKFLWTAICTAWCSSKMPGYEAKFVNPVLKRHECPVCLYPMRNPFKVECGHIFCRECLDAVLKTRQPPVCPLDKKEITDGVCYGDSACNQEILDLEVYCNFMTSGCCWVGALKHLEVSVSIMFWDVCSCSLIAQFYHHWEPPNPLFPPNVWSHMHSLSPIPQKTF